MAFEPTTTTMAIQMVVERFRIISEIVAYARPFFERVRTCVFEYFRIDLNNSGYVFEHVRAFALLEVPLLHLPSRNIQWLSRAPCSQMLAAHTTELQRPTSGKVGPCPRPKLCNNHRPEFNFCSKALDPGDLWERATFNIALRKRTAGQPFSPEQHVKEEGPRLEPHQLSRALAGTRGSVGAEMEDRTPVARLATAQRGPQSHQHECKAI